MISFKDYVQQQLDKPSPDWFDLNGNSPRAVIMRGRFGQLKYEVIDLIPSLKRDLSYFWDGFDTPVSYFFQVALLPFIFPLLPFLRAFYVYRRALRDYKREYDAMIERSQK